MWILIIIIVIFGFILWGNNTHQNINEEIRTHNNSVGGFRSSFPNLVNILENELGMVLKYDDGRCFCYKKVEKSEELTIGLKLDEKNYKIMFSALEKNGKKETGRDVPFISDNDNIQLDVTIELCTENLNTSINKKKYKKKYLKDWQNIKSTLTNETFIFEHINNLFILDDINPKKFHANLYYRKIGFNFDNDDHTKSITQIIQPAKAFTNFFICAYPDVYLWVQENNSRINAFKGLENASDEYFRIIENIIPMYRSIINQYKKEQHKLECK